MSESVIELESTTSGRLRRPDRKINQGHPRCRILKILELRIPLGYCAYEQSADPQLEHTMGIRIDCPMCGKQLNAPQHLAGKDVTCPKCGERLEVPAESKPNPYLSMGFITAASVAAIICIGLGFILGVVLDEKQLMTEREVIVEKPVEVEVEKIVEVPVENRNAVMFVGEYKSENADFDETEKYRKLVQVANQLSFRQFLEDPNHDIATVMRKLEILSHSESDIVFLIGTYDVEMIVGNQTRSYPANMTFARSKSGQLTVVSGAEFHDYMMTRADRLKNKKIGL